MDNIELDNLKVKESAQKAIEHAKAEKLGMLKCYHRIFKTQEGEKVLQDLSAKFIYGNDTPLSSANIDYEAAYHNGESGVVKFIINQIKQAEVL